MLPTLLPAQQRLLSDGARIFLVTCSPGQALYERYGHTALMVIDDELGISEVYNYGIFDFSTEHFYWRFVRGETFYQLGKEGARWFIDSYTYGKRTVLLCSFLLIPTISAVTAKCFNYTSDQSLSCVRLCDPMNRSRPGLPVHHQLPECTQTHVHRISDAIQPSHPLPSPSPPAPKPSQHQSFPMSQLFA